MRSEFADMPDRQNVDGDARSAPARPLPPTGDDACEVSLELLRRLLGEWHHHWAMVDAEAQRLPRSTKRALQDLPTDPQDALRAARPAFAESFHPEVVAFFRVHLDAAAQTVGQLLHEHRQRSTGPVSDAGDLEWRVRRLETVLGGVGAVLGVLGPDCPPDP